MKNKILMLMSAILISSLFAITFVNASWTSNLDEGLIAYYDFNEGSGTTSKDLSGHQEDINLLGTTTWTSGKVGGGINFREIAGSVAVVYNLTQNFTQSTPITFSYWVNTPSANGLMVGVNKQLLNWVGDWEGFNVAFGDLGGGVKPPYLYLGGYYGKQALSNSGIVYNNWTHYVIIFNGTSGEVDDYNFKIYMNGNLTTPPADNWIYTSPASPTFNVNSFTIGNFYGSGVASSFKANGNYSDVAIYNRTLNETEVLQLYNEGSGLAYPTETYDINFVEPTDIDNYGYQRQNILVNVTAEDFGAGLSNITIRFFNSSKNQIASVNQASSPLYYNYSTGVDGVFYFNATACDINNVCNSTETRSVRLDTFNPLVNIEYPEDLRLYGTNINRVTFTAVNTGTIDECWIILNNNGTNISVPNCTEGTNMTFIGFTSLEGVNTIEVWAKDIVNLTGSHTHTYGVDTTAPTIAIVYPNSTNKTSLVTALNYTYADSNPNQCWFSNNSGVTNSTKVNAGINFTNIVTSNGTNIIILYCDDDIGNLQTTSITFTINLPVVPEEPQSTLESNLIYQVLNTSGAGLGIFIQIMSIALPPLLIILGIIGIIVLIGFVISNVIKNGLTGRKA